MLKIKLKTRGGESLWYKSVSYLLNNIAPSLIYDFSNEKYYNVVSGSQGFPFTATRTSNAMMFNSVGNMVWAPANMLLNTTGFTTSWNLTNCSVTSSNLQDPTGGSRAVEITESALTASAFQTNVTIVPGQALTYSIYIKSTTALFARLRILNTGFSNGVRVQVDLTTGAVSAPANVSSGTPISASAVSAGNGWWRVSLSGVCFTASTVLVEVSSATSLADPTTVNGSVFRVFGPQLEYYDTTSPKAYNVTAASAFYGPRFDTDPSTLLPVGLLIEAAATNLVLNSHTYTSGWSLVNCSLSTLTTDPMGLSNGQTILDGIVAATSLSHTVVTTVASTVYNASVHLKRGNTDWVRVRVLDTTGLIGFQCWINLATGAKGTANLIGTGTYSANSFQVIPIKDGWYKVTLAGTVGAATTMAITTQTASADASATNVSAGTYEIWGHQIELTSGSLVCTSYVPTFSATTTRAADNFSVSMSPWADVTKGTFFTKSWRGYDAAPYIARPFSFSDGTTNNRVQIHLSNTIAILHSSGGVDQVPSYSGGPLTLAGFGETQNFAFLYSALGSKVAAQGGPMYTSATAVAPVNPNNLRLGGNISSTISKAWIKEIRYYPDASASDAQLQTLTT